MDKIKFDNFECAFDMHTGGCRHTCACGKTYYNSDGGWDWDEGELEKLKADENAIDLDHAVGLIYLEGCEFVMDCDCWHKRAEHVMAFIDAHAQQIADYLRLEKIRKQIIADVSPVADEGG